MIPLVICRRAFGVSLLVTLVVLPAMSAPAPENASAFDDLVGWYRIDPHETALLTYAADGNLMLYHFGEPPYANRITRSEEGALLWSRGENEPPRTVRFSRNEAASPILQWRAEAGEWRDAPRIAGPYDVSERSFRNGAVTLSGTLFLPNLPGPHSGVAFIHGSGASTRDNFWYVWIADRLARNAVAVLLPDKRGTGKSEGDWETASFHDYAGDAAAAVRTLRSIPNVADDRVGALGVSQGGHIAPMVPKLDPDLAFLVNLSGSAVPIEEQLRLELTNTLRQEGWPRFAIPLVRPIAMRVVKRRRPLWWKQNGKLDPIPYWRELDIPALVVYGAQDEQDNVPVRRSVERLQDADLADGRKHITLIIYPDSGHALYAAGTRRIREDFLATLVKWVRTGE